MNTRRKLLLAGLGGGLGAMTDLQRITAAAGQALIGSAHAQTADDYRALICLFMFGGNDCNNTVLPVDAGQRGLYNQARGPLALDANQVLPISPTNTGGLTYALHPAMTGMQKLFQQGKAAILANVGPLAAPTTKAQYEANSVPLPPNVGSHSDQQAQWQSSISDGSGRSGWAGRVGDLVQTLNSNRGATCISLAGNNLWQTGASISSYKVSPSGNFGFDFYKPNSSEPISISISEMLNQSRAHLFEQAWLSTMQRALENQRVMAGAITSQEFTANFPNSNIGTQLRMAARLITARSALGVKRQTIFVSVGGFDTHGDDQLGRQQQLLGEISAAVSAFYDATVAMGVADKVTLYTASDFGRTLQSNGAGSDHGWGGHHFIVGGAVNGGMMYGTYPNLARRGPDDTGGSGVWIPTTSVDQYSATLARWFGVSATDMSTVFPLLSRFSTPDLGIMA